MRKSRSITSFSNQKDDGAIHRRASRKVGCSFYYFWMVIVLNENEWIEYLQEHKDKSDWDEACTKFYKSNIWRSVRAQVLKSDHYECQMCKSRGKFTKAQTVHHVIHLRDEPNLALTTDYNGKRQLISLCDACHNVVHPEKNIIFRLKDEKKDEILTEERW